MTACVVWFNGPSSHDWLGAPRWCWEIGCNSRLQDRPMDAVVIYDRQLLGHERRDHARRDTQFYTREAAPGYLAVPGIPGIHAEQSGTLAVQLAVVSGHRDIFIVGCDWGVDRSTVYQYPHASGPVKYTNSQRQVLQRLAERPGVTISVVADQPRDVNLPHIRSVDYQLIMDHHRA